MADCCSGRGTEKQTELAEMKRSIDDLSRAIRALQQQWRAEAHMESSARTHPMVGDRIGLEVLESSIGDQDATQWVGTHFGGETMWEEKELPDLVYDEYPEEEEEVCIEYHEEVEEELVCAYYHGDVGVLVSGDTHRESPARYLQGGPIILVGRQPTSEVNPSNDLKILVDLDDWAKDKGEHGRNNGFIFEDDGDGYELPKEEYLLTRFEWPPDPVHDIRKLNSSNSKCFECSGR